MADEMNNNGTQTMQSARLMRAATYASVSVAVILVVVKLAAWLETDSVSLLSTLVDSLMDVMASVINLVAVRHALMPADHEHRFGHGKAEPLAGLAQSAFIAGSAVFLLIEAGERLFQPRAINNPEFGYGVLIFTIAITLVLVIFQKFVIRRTKSVAISADSLHFQSDLLLNSGAMVSIFLVSEFAYTIADPLFAIGIAGFILWGAWKIARRSLDILMDTELPDEDRQRIIDIAMGHDEVLDIHDLRTRSSGQSLFIQMHLEMSRDLTLLKAHEISDEVMWMVMDVFKNADVLIHTDPEGIEEAHQHFG